MSHVKRYLILHVMPEVCYFDHVVRFQDECVVLAHVPLADIEWSRNGPRFSLQEGIIN